jgi:hypothetical protein
VSRGRKERTPAPPHQSRKQGRPLNLCSANQERAFVRLCVLQIRRGHRTTRALEFDRYGRRQRSGAARRRRVVAGTLAAASSRQAHVMRMPVGRLVISTTVLSRLISRLVDAGGRCTPTPSSAATGSEGRRCARRSRQPIAVHAHVQQAIKYKKTNSTQINSQQGEKLRSTGKAFYN